MVIRVNDEKTVISITTQTQLFLSYIIIILIFSLFRTAVLSSYKNIILILALIKTVFLSSYKKMWDKVITENGGTLMFLSVCYKN